MRIAYFVNSLDSPNWGGQATSTGIRDLVSMHYPGAEFVPLDLPNLCSRNIPFLRRYLDRRLGRALLADDLPGALRLLRLMNIPASFFDGFDTVCFNGEGAIHGKSGHLVRLLGIVYCFKRKGAYVAALNQTVDLGNDRFLQSLVRKVYGMVDALAVREPLSADRLKDLGLTAQVIPDAAYALPRITHEECLARTRELSLPAHFIGITGSSALGKNRKSIAAMRRLVQAAQGCFKLPIIMLANTKTDLYLAKKLEHEFDYRIISYKDARFDRATAIIGLSDFLLGGRQHPMIFAAIQGIPFLPLHGNTFKNEGVCRLLNYPFKVRSWDASAEELCAAIEECRRAVDRLKRLSVPVIHSFPLDKSR